MSDDRTTIPPPPLGSVEVPAVKAFGDAPELDATDRAWALHFVKISRELAARSVTLTIPIGLWIVLVLLAADAAIDIVYRLARLAGHL